MNKLPETLRPARVLDIIWQIQAAPRQWTRRKLAEHFGVSERTITDDLAMIRNGLGFEIESARGMGYAFTRDAPRLPAVAYSPQEALALILAALAGRQMAGTPEDALLQAVNRLSAVIPRDLRVLIERLEDQARREGASQVASVLSVCTTAAAMNLSVDIAYRAASGDGSITTRRVDPYALVPYERSWHVVGYCHLRESIRVFKVERILTAAPTTARFERPASFSVADFLNSGWGIIRGMDAPEEEVVLHFHGMPATWVAEDQGHPSQQTVWQPDGTLRFSARIQITDEFRRWVLRHGRNVRVEQPEHLRSWLADEAQAMLQMATSAAAS